MTFRVPQNHECHGFTLIEMIIALMLLSMISLVGYHSIMFGLERWHKDSEQTMGEYNFLQSINWLRNKLGAAELISHPQQRGGGYQFSGEPKSLEFVARYDRSNQSGLYINRMTLDPEHNNLVIEYLLHHPDIDPTDGDNPQQQVTLLKGIDSLQLSYYGRQNNGDTAWYDRWNDPKNFPQLVRIQLGMANGQSYSSTISVMTSNMSI